MQTTLIRSGAVLTTLSCLSLLGMAQVKGIQPTGKKTADKFEALRKTANTNARALATCVQGRAISTNKYDNVLSDYATDLGGSIPINPCTGTRTGYTMVVFDHGQQAKVAATAGNRCGKWVPQVFRLTL